MREDRREIRARLAAALDEADAIENQPIEEVRAALMEQGIDPTASIKLARKLAHGSAADDPSARLLQQIERSETVDAEISALEEAEIDDVKAALAPGIGRSHRSHHALSGQAGAKVVLIQPRRRLSALGWGGSLIGIAASVLLFIAVRPDRLEQADVPSASIQPRPPAALDAESADAVSEGTLPPPQAPLPEPSQLQGKASAGNARHSAEQADFADATEQVSVARTGKRAAQSPDEKRAKLLAETQALVLEKHSERDSSLGMTTSKTEGLQSPQLPAPRPGFEESMSSETAALAQKSAPVQPMAEPLQNPPRPVVAERDRVEMAIVTSRPAPPPMKAADALNLQNPPSDPAVLLTRLADLKAILLIDETRAPSSLRALSNRLPEGRLTARLGEAELQAAGGKVIALIAFARDGAIVEAALVETPSIQTAPDPSAQMLTGFTGFADDEPALLLGSEASFELIELSAGP